MTSTQIPSEPVKHGADSFDGVELDGVLPVTQADREAAVAWYRASGQIFTDNIAEGFEDDGSLVQAFARHRLAALSTPPVSRDAEARAEDAILAGQAVLGGEGDGTYEEACDAIQQLIAALSASPSQPVDRANDEQRAFAARLKEAARQWRTGAAVTLRGIDLEPTDLERAARLAFASPVAGGEVTLLEAASDLLDARERLGPAVMERYDLWRCLAEIVAEARS